MQPPKSYSVGGQRSSRAAYRQARRRPARLQGSLVRAEAGYGEVDNEVDSEVERTAPVETSIEGFLLLLSQEGVIIYTSEEVMRHTGLSQVTSNSLLQSPARWISLGSVFGFIQTCDKEEMCKVIGAKQAEAGYGEVDNEVDSEVERTAPVETSIEGFLLLLSQEGVIIYTSEEVMRHTGLSQGSAFGRWENIKTISNESAQPLNWTKKITKKVGYTKEKMSSMEHNWKISMSATYQAGDLTAAFAKYQFSLSAEYGGRSINTEKEDWSEATEVEESIEMTIQPNEKVYIWQYNLGFGKESVLFCRDLKITKTSTPPTEIPLPPSTQ
ncbi:UNVERIFIED_CONTAM: hypothetical protein FKN15_004086 [Acipenser sinensis]